jgi:hypothetical protein
MDKQKKGFHLVMLRDICLNLKVVKKLEFLQHEDIQHQELTRDQNTLVY